MELLLYAWILFFITLSAGAVFGAYKLVRHLLKDTSEKKRLLRAARVRYNRMLTKTDHLCPFCSDPCNMEKDLHSDTLGWVHERCYQLNVPQGVSNEVRKSVEVESAVHSGGRVRNSR